MVNAGLIPATVTLNVRAQFWSKVLPGLTLHPDMVLKEEGQLAFALRKDSPNLQALLNEFIKGHQMGTVFGNTLLHALSTKNQVGTRFHIDRGNEKVSSVRPLFPKIRG